MQRTTWLAALMILGGLVEGTVASDHTGVYALIEKVTVSKAGTPEETVRIRGIFSLAIDRNDYREPVYGEMVFRLRAGDEELCRREWADLKSVAGSGGLVAFASRYRPGTREAANLGTIHSPGRRKAAKPDEYSGSQGVQKLRHSMDYLPHRRVACFAAPKSPTGAAVNAGSVKFTVHNALTDAKDIEYHFELANEDGVIEASGPVKAGDDETTWTPKAEVKPGVKYTWRAWTVTQWKRGERSGTWKGPVATTKFRGRKNKKNQ